MKQQKIHRGLSFLAVIFITSDMHAGCTASVELKDKQAGQTSQHEAEEGLSLESLEAAREHFLKFLGAKNTEDNAETVGRFLSTANRSALGDEFLRARDAQGNTPLHLAIISGKERCAYSLVAMHRAPLHVTNSAGFTPLSLADLYGRTLIKEKIQSELTKEASHINSTLVTCDTSNAGL